MGAMQERALTLERIVRAPRPLVWGLITDTDRADRALGLAPPRYVWREIEGRRQLVVTEELLAHPEVTALLGDRPTAPFRAALEGIREEQALVRVTLERGQAATAARAREVAATVGK
jgi:hypothetical protein